MIPRNHRKRAHVAEMRMSVVLLLHDDDHHRLPRLGLVVGLDGDQNSEIVGGKKRDLVRPVPHDVRNTRGVVVVVVVVVRLHPHDHHALPVPNCYRKRLATWLTLEQLEES